MTGEGLGQMAQVFGTLLCGYIIAFYFVWQCALLSMAFMPFMMARPNPQWHTILLASP